MENALLPLVILASGFIFLRTFHRSKHRWDALQWEHNLFEAAIYGALLFILVRFLGPYAAGCPFVQFVRDEVRRAVPFPYSASLAFTVALAVLGAKFLNVYFDRQEAIQRAVNRHGGELLILLQQAAGGGVPVMLTMDSRKVYVGLVAVAPAPKYPYTVIFPTVSGYRDEKDHRVHFTTRYGEVYEALGDRFNPREFLIVLPVPGIVSARLFDNDTYQHFEPPTAGPINPT